MRIAGEPSFIYSLRGSPAVGAGRTIGEKELQNSIAYHLQPFFCCITTAQGRKWVA